MLPSIWFLTPSGLTVAVEPAMQVDQCKRPFRVPTVLVRAHPLHADRPARGARQERGVRSGVFVAVAAIAARAVDIDAADIGYRHRQHRRELLAQEVRRLRGGPERRNSKSPFAAANLSSFPPGPELRSRLPEPESSPEEE